MASPKSGDPKGTKTRPSSPDDLTRGGKGATPELSEEELRKVSGGGAKSQPYLKGDWVE